MALRRGSSVTLNTMLKEANQGKIITPLVRAALTNPDFEGFTIEVEGWEARLYDGYFHPSTHTSWTARQLSYYLTHPDDLVQETPDLLFVLAVTQGKFWHKFIQRLLISKGVMIQDEAPLLDLDYNRKGNADGILYNGEWFEFKTMSDRLIKKVKSVEDLKAHHPTYYAQTQDYLDISGAHAMRYFIMALASPFPMEEFVVPADPAFQAAQRMKYRDAIIASETEERPPPCCHPKSSESRSCPVRFACPIGSRVA